jgi:SAM-dependent methyltransferase
MGIAFQYVRKMDELGLLRPGMSILDVGSSNLYSASPQEIADFVRKYAPSPGGAIEEFAARLARGSAYDPVKGGLNESFVGELFEKAGMEYVSIDIADGYRTVILDLNRSELPPEFRGKFDLVLNFGTTEHVLNQFNCFKVIHDATKLGGHIYHALPAVGYVDHGYITYTAKCFFDVAGYNEYEIVDLWFEASSARNDLYASVRSYRAYFPALERRIAELESDRPSKPLNDFQIPDVSINVIYHKRNDKPFRGALETTTSVGNIPLEVTTAYGVGFVAAGAMRSRRRIAAALEGHPFLYSIARRIYRILTRR